LMIKDFLRAAAMRFCFFRSLDHPICLTILLNSITSILSGQSIQLRIQHTIMSHPSCGCLWSTKFRLANSIFTRCHLPVATSRITSHSGKHRLAISQLLLPQRPHVSFIKHRTRSAVIHQAERTYISFGLGIVGHGNTSATPGRATETVLSIRSIAPAASVG